MGKKGRKIKRKNKERFFLCVWTLIKDKRFNFEKMSKKSFIVLGFLVLCLKMMASNAGDNGEPTILMSDAEKHAMWTQVAPKFVHNGISEEQCVAYKNGDGSRKRMKGSNGSTECDLSVSANASSMSCYSVSSKGSINANTHSSSGSYSSADGSQNDNKAEYNRAIRIQEQIREKIQKTFSQPNIPNYSGRNWF